MADRLIQTAEDIETALAARLGFGPSASAPPRHRTVTAASSPVGKLAAPSGAVATRPRVALQSPMSFSDLLEVLTAGGIDAGFQPQVLTDVTVVAANTTTVVTATIPTGSVLVTYDLAFFVSNATTDFLVTLATDNVTLFSDMVMAIDSPPALKGAFLRPVQNAITWTYANNSSQQTAATYWLQGAYVDQTTWFRKIVPALQQNARVALAMGSLLGSVKA